MLKWEIVWANPGRGERGGKACSMKFPKGSTLAKLIIPVLLIYAFFMMTDAAEKRAAGESLVASLRQQAEKLRRENELLRQDIESAGDEEFMAELARKNFGYVRPDEIVFYDPSHREGRAR